MKSKILTTFLLTVILTLAVVSAADFSVSTNSLDLSKSVDEASFTITNTGIADITVTVPEFNDLSDDDGNTVVLSQSNSGAILIAVGGEETITVSYDENNLLPAGTDLEDLALGTFSENIVVTDGIDNSTINLDFLSSFCEKGNVEETISEGTRDLEIVYVKDKSSEDDWEWKPLDEVEIEVKVRFNSDDEDDDIDAIIEVALYDSDENEWIDLDNEDDLEVEVTMDEGEKVTETFTIEVPVEDLEDSDSRYQLYVKVYEDGDEEVVCIDFEEDEYFKEIKVEKESYDVVLNGLEVTSPVPCGQEAEITGMIYNIGSHDEDKTIVTIKNTELGVDEKSPVFELDEGDSQRFSFNFLVPEDADEDTYSLKLYTSYRFRDSSDTYRENSDDYTVLLRVEGNCKAEEEASNVQVTADLDSDTPEAIAGQEVKVNAELRNTGEDTTTYTVSVSGNSAWSSLVSITPSTITLDAGESKTIPIVLELDEDASGDQEFTIKVAYDSKVTEQEVGLAIEADADQSQAFKEHLRENWFIYVIVLVNLILIIAIILVIKRMLTPRNAM